MRVVEGLVLINCQTRELPETPKEQLIKARNIAIESGLQYVYLNLPDEEETLCTFCPKCKKIVAERIFGGKTSVGLKNNSCAQCGEKISGVW